jgi:DNA repair protein RadC
MRDFAFSAYLTSVKVGTMNYFDLKLSIPNWQDEDKPREKLLLKGRNSLTDAELIAILLGSGIPGESAVELARRLLIAANNNLVQLSNLEVKDFRRFKGVGPAKAATIMAALELGRRRKDAVSAGSRRLLTSDDAYHVVRGDLEDIPHEEFWVVFLNKANSMITKKCISKGGIGGTVADIKIIFKQAIDLLASAIILVHNHPSGNLKPSQSDKELTRKMKQTGELMEVIVLDHLIITNNGYFSFSDHSLL